MTPHSGFRNGAGPTVPSANDATRTFHRLACSPPVTSSATPLFAFPSPSALSDPPEYQVDPAVRRGIKQNLRYSQGRV